MFTPCINDFIASHDALAFDDVTDIQEVVPDMCVSVQECLDSNIVPAAAGELDYNGNETFAEIRPYAEDNIQIAQAARAFGQSLKATPTEVDPTKQTI